MLTQLKDQLAAGSSEEYLQKLFDKIEHSKLNAFTILAKDNALARAREFDRGPGRAF